jgi:hypothetical protein
MSPLPSKIIADRTATRHARESAAGIDSPFDPSQDRSLPALEAARISPEIYQASV